MDGLGTLYVFASKFKMENLLWSILAELNSRHTNSAAVVLIQAAKIVYKELGGDELFQLLYKPPQPHESDYPEVKISELVAEGGRFGEDLTGAMLAALLNKKLSLVSIQQPKIVPPSIASGMWGLGPADRPMVREGTAIACHDWNGGGFSNLAFREGDRITQVVSTPPKKVFCNINAYLVK